MRNIAGMNKLQLCLVAHKIQVLERYEKIPGLCT
jgi:hypothetical protein